MIEGWYYLHTNGELIYKREIDGSTAADIRESDFARGLWPVDPADRAGAWTILVEGLAAGADRPRVLALAERWGCGDGDAEEYAKRLGVRLARDGNQWCATRADFVNLQESKAGFGRTCLEAMADLARELGYRPSKMWGTTFAELVKVTEVAS